MKTGLALTLRLTLRLAELDRPVNRTRWNTSANTVNAFAAGGNRIVFPAGILQSPFFEPAARKACAERVAQLCSGCEPAPLVEGRTPEQRFFIANAVICRGKQREAALLNQLRTGQHSPGRYRVLGPITHQPAFAKAFGCRAGDAMVAADPILVW